MYRISPNGLINDISNSLTTSSVDVVLKPAHLNCKFIQEDIIFRDDRAERTPSNVLFGQIFCIVQACNK